MISVFALGFSGDAKPTTWRDLAAKNYDHSFDQYLATTTSFIVGKPSTTSARRCTTAPPRSRPTIPTPRTRGRWASPHADKTEAEWKAMKGYNRHQAFNSPNPSLGLLGRAAPLAVEDLPTASTGARRAW